MTLRLSDLRSFLDNPNARFKTSQQAEVSEAIARGEPSLLVIGPTGLFSSSRCAISNA